MCGWIYVFFWWYGERVFIADFSHVQKNHQISSEKTQTCIHLHSHIYIAQTYLHTKLKLVLYKNLIRYVQISLCHDGRKNGKRIEHVQVVYKIKAHTRPL